jgi:hypothetical protein
MITTEYIHKFIDHTIIKHVPEGIDPILHVNARVEIRSVIMKLLKQQSITFKIVF